MGQEEIEQEKYFKYLESIITEDMRFNHEVKIQIAIAREAFNQKRKLLYGRLDRTLRKRLVKYFVWSVVLYSTETWSLRIKDERRLKAFEMWIWRRKDSIK